MQRSVSTILSSASSYVHSGETEGERAALLFRFLTGRLRYSITDTEPAMPAYSLLCQGIAHSLSFSSVFNAECGTAGLECRMMEGTLNGQTRYWNLLCIDGEYYHVDLMRAVERGETELTLLTSAELREEGYIWDESSHPATPEPEPIDGSTPTEPDASTEPTEPSTEPPTEAPTEPSTEPSSESAETTGPEE